MREKELRKRSKCGLCGNQIGPGGPMFWTVKIERHILDLRAINRQQGLTMMLGGAAPLAAVMGPNEEMTKALGDPIEFTVCGNCDIEKTFCIAQLAERFAVDEDDETK